jgi:DNA-binding XRE family transcriptional regulator
MPRTPTESAGRDGHRARPRRWGRRAVIHAIQERRDRGLPLHHSAVVADDEPLAGAARRWFGSWDAALRAAGIDPEAVRNPRAERAPPGTWSAARVLDLIREHAGAGADLAAHRMQATDPGLVAAAVQHFGSWREAIGAAGFDYGLICLRRHWTRDAVLQRLKQLGRAGADLSYQTAAAWDGGFLAMAVEHFGSWDAALKAAGVAVSRRTVHWSKARILQAIRSGAAEDGGGLRKAAVRVFGSWGEAVRAAGRPEDRPGPVRCSARQVRRRQGLSLEEVGRRAGYSHRAVSMVELGQWPDPRVSLALRLARALDAPVEELFQLGEQAGEEGEDER